MVELTLNGQLYTANADTTVRDLLAMLGFGIDGFAVAVNGTVVPRAEHASTTFAAGDRVEVIRAVGGG